MTPQAILFKDMCQKYLNSIKHLEESLKRCKGINLDKKEFSENELVELESLASRFSRSSDIFTSKIIRFLVMEADPGFRGTFIDLANQAEKQALIDDATVWIKIREKRNQSAHDYSGEPIKEIYKEYIFLCPTILKTATLVKDLL